MSFLFFSNYFAAVPGCTGKPDFTINSIAR